MHKFIILFAMLSMICVIYGAHAQEKTVFKYRSTLVCEYDNSSAKWGDWKETFTLITVLTEEDRIKVHADQTVIYDVINVETKSEIKEGKELTYYEVKAEDPNGKDVWITFGESGDGLRFIIHSGENLKDIICYAVNELP